MAYLKQLSKKSPSPHFHALISILLHGMFDFGILSKRHRKMHWTVNSLFATVYAFISLYKKVNNFCVAFVTFFERFRMLL